MVHRRAHLALLFLAAASALPGADPKSLTHQPAVILLDFGDHRVQAPAGSWVYPRSILQLPEERAVFCTSTHFPEDIFCEVGVVIERDFPDQFITEVNMTYPHPTVPDTACTVRLDLDEGSNSRARLTFRDFDCEPASVNITDVPPFQVQDVQHLTIRTQRYDNVNYICWHEFKNAVRGTDAEKEGDETYEEPNVKFVHDGISCISAISFPAKDEKDEKV